MDYPGLNTNIYALERGHNLEVAVRPMLVMVAGMYHRNTEYKFVEMIENKNYVQVAIKPMLVTMAPGVYHRNTENELVPVCIPDNQNPLEYLPIYRYSNCYANCRIKAMLHICGCIPFTFDYLASHHSVNQCDIKGLRCIQENMQRISIVKDTRNENFTCSCRTPCNNVMYETLPKAIVQMNTGDPSEKNNASGSNAILKVFMDMQTFMILETLPAADEIYLLASIGGIFSLFLGCSFLSLVEVIYFFGLFCRAIILSRKVKSASSKEHEARNDLAKRRGY
nr:PREDICTED: sodium channel protein Nach-like [Megachile rotundata]